MKPLMPSPSASRWNLENAHQRGRFKLYRSRDGTAVVKLLIWQSRIGGEPRPSQRALARQLGVSQPYICKVTRKAPGRMGGASQRGNVLHSRGSGASAGCDGSHERACTRSVCASPTNPRKDRAQLRWTRPSPKHGAKPTNGNGTITIPVAGRAPYGEWQELERRRRRRGLRMVPFRRPRMMR
jgi:hypothetical protein